MKSTLVVFAALVAALAISSTSAARLSSMGDHLTSATLGAVKGFEGVPSNADVTAKMHRIPVTDADDAVSASAKKPRRFNEVKIMPGHDKREVVSSALPHTYVKKHKLPKNFVWSNVSGVNYLTKNLNQHIPQYCGSCWAHGAMSALADRIKIANGKHAHSPDVNLAIQFILNCGADVAGSCHGGSHSGAYQFVYDAGFIPFDTCLIYEACSAESSEGTCAAEGKDYTCNAMNTCRTCSTFSDMVGSKNKK